MKKFLAGGFVVLVVIAMVVGAFVGIASRSLDRELATLTAPTLEELDALGARLAEAEPQESPEVPKPQEAGDTETLIEESSVLPTRLASMLSPELLEERFAASPDELWRYQLLTPVTKLLEGAFSVVSEKWSADLIFERSRQLMAVGKWDEARRCLWKVLDAPLDPSLHRHALESLAWIEEDPEIAARLLELSVQGDDQCHGHMLANAVKLSRVTGSNALAEHYLARLRTEDPEMARRYEEE